ncbi:MAG: stability determinant [Nitrosomonadales bacterium]|nr:stability determinant [Nitrosomonadales bacterium]
MNTALSPIESQFATTDEADAYDAWFCAKVEKSMRLADEPNSARISHDEVMSKARARIEAKIKENATRRLA